MSERAYILIPVRVEMTVHVLAEIHEKTLRTEIANAAEEAALERIVDRDLSRATINTVKAKAKGDWYDTTSIPRGAHKPDVVIGIGSWRGSPGRR